MLLDKQPILLEGTVQNYSWGRVGADSLVARLVSKGADQQPYAELWFGAHPRGAARVNSIHGVTTLDRLIAADPERILGHRVSARFSGQLPFLFKVLSVNQALSIQAHPDKSRASLLHQRRPAEYPDANHKPEVAIPLTEMKLLYGFRPKEEIQRELKLTPELAKVAGDPLSDQLMLADLHAAILHSSPELREEQCRLLKTRLSGIETLRAIDQLLLELISLYGYRDVGIFTALLMNLCTLAPGQAVYVDANIPHAYLCGDLIECMANSDNVVRAGLTPKFQDAETLIEMLNYESSQLKPIDPSRQGSPVMVRRYQTPAVEFALEEISGRGEQSDVTDGKPVLLVAVEGSGVIESGDLKLTVATGRAALVPACAERYSLQLDGSARFFRVTVPD